MSYLWKEHECAIYSFLKYLNITLNFPGKLYCFCVVLLSTREMSSLIIL